MKEMKEMQMKNIEFRNQNAIRDPVHGWIRFSDSEKEVIDSPLFQRLRSVTQLSMADQVFPGGCHSRFIHSLGVMKMVGKYLKQLFRNIVIDGSEGRGREYICSKKDKVHAIKLGRMCGLLHDIGHGAFSHAWDRSVFSEIYGPEMNSHYPDGGHDVHRLNMIKHPLLREPIEKSGISPEEIIKVWTASPDDGLYFIIKTVVGGPLGGDRIDFILRDSYFTGTQHLGTIASDRIISNSMLLLNGNVDDIWTSPDLYICYRDKCLNDMIQALDGRRLLYEDVYFHKTVMAATILIEEMLSNSIDDLQLIENTKDLNSFMFLNEHTLIGKIMSLPRDHASRKYCERLLCRNLPKLKVDTMYPASLLWDEDEWKEQHPEHKNYTFIRTRPITGIDPMKFDHYKIKFIKRNGKTVSCKSLLKFVKFKPMDAYYIVRGYQL